MGLFADMIAKSAKSGGTPPVRPIDDTTTAKKCRDAVANLDSHNNWPSNIQFKWRKMDHLAVCLCIYEGKELDYCYTVSIGSERQFDSVTGYRKNAREWFALQQIPGQTPTQAEEARLRLEHWDVEVQNFNPYTVVSCILKDLIEKASLNPKRPDDGKGNEEDQFI